MSTFIMDTRNNHINVRAAVQDTADIAHAEHFRDAVGLATLGAGWPMARLVEIWNNLPGARPVTRFTDRKTAIDRICKALQGLQEALPPETAPQPEATPTVALERAQTPPVAHAKKDASCSETAPKPVQQSTPNHASKRAQFVALLRRPQGVTLTQLMAATGWQAPSVRGSLSGTLGKKMRLLIESVKAENGERTYLIEA